MELALDRIIFARYTQVKLKSLVDLKNLIVKYTLRSQYNHNLPYAALSC